MIILLCVFYPRLCIMNIILIQLGPYNLNLALFLWMNVFVLGVQHVVLLSRCYEFLIVFLLILLTHNTNERELGNKWYMWNI